MPPKTRLTKTQIDEIRACYSNSKISLKTLAVKFGLSLPAISRIGRNQQCFDPNYEPPKRKRTTFSKYKYSLELIKKFLTMIENDPDRNVAKAARACDITYDAAYDIYMGKIEIYLDQNESMVEDIPKQQQRKKRYGSHSRKKKIQPRDISLVRFECPTCGMGFNQEGKPFETQVEANACCKDLVERSEPNNKCKYDLTRRNPSSEYLRLFRIGIRRGRR